MAYERKDILVLQKHVGEVEEETYIIKNLFKLIFTWSSCL